MMLTVPQVHYGLAVLSIPFYFAVVRALYRRHLWQSYLFLSLSLIVEGVTIT